MYMKTLSVFTSEQIDSEEKQDSRSIYKRAYYGNSAGSGPCSHNHTSRMVGMTGDRYVIYYKTLLPFMAKAFAQAYGCEIRLL